MMTISHIVPSLLGTRNCPVRHGEYVVSYTYATAPYPPERHSVPVSPGWRHDPQTIS